MFPPTVQEHSIFSTPSPKFIVYRLFDDCHSDQCEVISHCSFDWHFFNTTQVFLPGEFYGQRSLAGYSPQGCKELDTTEVTFHAHTHTTVSKSAEAQCPKVKHIPPGTPESSRRWLDKEWGSPLPQLPGFHTPCNNVLKALINGFWNDQFNLGSVSFCANIFNKYLLSTHDV